MSGLQASHRMDNQQQVSFHFWNCQLTQACPKYSWDPENWATAVAAAAATDALDKGERRQRRHGDGEADAHSDKSKENGVGSDATHKTDTKESTGGESGGEKSAEGSAHKSSDHKSDEKANGKANGDSNGHTNDKADDDENCEEAATDADYMQHVLKVNACILGVRASGVHLISVRTKCYQSDQPDTCPIVCIDPDSQRTLTLGYEFVLDSQNEVTFELTEGTGPVWLTGLHQVRVHETEDSGEGEGEGEEEEEEDDQEQEFENSSVGSQLGDDACCINKASRFLLASDDGVEKPEEADAEEELMEEGDGDSEDDSDDSGEGESEKPALGKRSPITTAQLRNRKRQRLENGESGGAE